MCSFVADLSKITYGKSKKVGTDTNMSLLLVPSKSVPTGLLAAATWLHTSSMHMQNAGIEVSMQHMVWLISRK